MPLGLGLIATSHYFDKDAGVLRAAGSATIAYGVAKIRENRQLTEDASLSGSESTIKTRLVKFKDELLNAFYIDKVLPEKQEKEESTQTEESETVEGLTESEISKSLDLFEQNNQNKAFQYEVQQQTEQAGLEEDEQDEQEDLPEADDEWEDEQEEFSYALVDDEPDLSTI